MTVAEYGLPAKAAEPTARHDASMLRAALSLWPLP